MSAESDPLLSPDHEPTRALLVAQALDQCIEAERRLPGSANTVIARQPEWARAELRRLIRLATALDAAAESAVISEDFRVAARARLMHRIAPNQVRDLSGAAGQNGPVVHRGPRLTAVPSRNGHHVVRRSPK